jgi:hemoglobin-like flavoprotein
MDVSSELTAAQISNVTLSFDRMWPNSTMMADRFYDRLFEIAPETRSLFRGDLVAQKRKFISTLAVLVGSLDNMTGLLSVAGKLAADHVHYGVKAEHYDAVGEALLWSLARGLGDYWTGEVEQSWRKVFAFLSERMIEAAYD